MKKLLTLVLALVLVFAIAAPALAITDTTADEENDPQYVDFVNIDLGLFTAAPASVWGGFSITPVASNKAYIANEMLYYGVKINYPKLTAPKTANLKADDYEDAELFLSATGVNLEVPEETYIFDKNGDVPTGVDMSTWSWDWEDDDDYGIMADAFVKENLGNGYTMYAFGQGVVAKKGVVTLELASIPEWPLEIYDGVDLAFKVVKGTSCSMGAEPTATPAGRGDDFEVYMYDTDDGSTLAQVAFNLKTSKKVAAIYVADPGVAWYQVGYGVTYVNGLQTKTAAKALIGADGKVYDIAVTDPTKAGYLKDSAELFGYYEDVMAYFGFDHTKDGLLLAKHFEAKDSALYLKDECVVQLYDAQIVVPSEVDVPKTGDAASIVGFVMIAVAMIAAGVVVSRKVRA